MFVWLGSSTNQRLHRAIIGLAIFYIIIVLYKRYKRREGFEDGIVGDKFIVKRGNDIYDPFYAGIYNKIHEPKDENREIVDFMISYTDIHAKRSVLLDVGSGTGEQMAYITERGYDVFGIDRSKAIVEQAIMTHPDLKIKVGDVSVPMMYDRNTFSHVLCTGLYGALYENLGKKIILENIFHWLKPGGYLILQIVDRDTFNPIPASGNSAVLTNPQLYSEERITNSEVQFVDFQYKSSFDFSSQDETVLVSEQFTENGTGATRKNERNLYINDMEQILQMAMETGFMVLGQQKMTKDDNQYIYLLQTP